MRASVGGKLHLGVVGDGAILHAGWEPEELSYPVFSVPRRHVGCDPVGDVDDSPAVVHLATDWDQVVVLGSGDRDIRGAGDSGIRCGGGGGERREEQEQEESGHGSCFGHGEGEVSSDGDEIVKMCAT